MKQAYSRDATQQQSAVESSYKLFDCRGLALKSHNTVNMCVHHRTICEMISFRSLGRLIRLSVVVYKTFHADSKSKNIINLMSLCDKSLDGKRPKHFAFIPLFRIMN